MELNGDRSDFYSRWVKANPTTYGSRKQLVPVADAEKRSTSFQ